MGQGVRTGLGHGGITCVLETQFSSLIFLPWVDGQILSFMFYHLGPMMTEWVITRGAR